MLAPCQTPAEQQAAKNAEITKRAAAEINRICVLPDEQREGGAQENQRAVGRRVVLRLQVIEPSPDFRRVALIR